MFHNWLEVQTWALDRQKELRKLGRETRIGREVRKTRRTVAAESACPVPRAETGPVTVTEEWRRAG